MAEYLDYYDINWNYLWKDTRENVHSQWLRHNTVHCWLYTSDWKIIFQIRSDTHTLYTTASWHVLSGETIKQAFNREIKEELGIEIDTSDAELVSIVEWKQDKIKSDWSEYHDRAKAHVYVNLYQWDFSEFNFDPNELEGIAVVDAKETLELFKKGNWNINTIIVKNGSDVVEKVINISDFLVTPNETYLWKYGDILEKVISLC